MPDASAPEVPGYLVSRLTLADADDWAAFALLPEMLRLTSSTAASVADLQAMIERTLGDDPNAPLLFALREPGSGQLLATFGFHTVSALNKTAEVTYSVRPQQWGKGLATALCQAAVNWAFEAQGWVRVQATTLEAHAASQRVLAKCGFEFEGRLRNFRLVRGEPSDFLLFARVPPGSQAAVL
ncbi:MAG: GNAT family N-acetyltransferase [Burkholderiaceae bacterium]|nr:GNAT family N-acetyltransferase [Burkholderiaceae bacterium]